MYKTVDLISAITDNEWNIDEQSQKILKNFYKEVFDPEIMKDLGSEYDFPMRSAHRSIRDITQKYYEKLYKNHDPENIDFRKLLVVLQRLNVHCDYIQKAKK